MKHLFKVTLFAAGILAATQGRAQTQEDHNVGHKITKTTKTVGHATAKTATTVGHATGEAATAVGHKTAEVAAKGTAVVVDRKYKGKMTRDGQTVYINSHSRYFYVDKRGHRVYVNKSDLRDKPSR